MSGCDRRTHGQNIGGDVVIRRVASSLFSIFCAVTSLPAFSQDFEQSWLKTNVSPCEGIGIHGSFRSYVVGKSEPKATDGSRRIVSLRVYASSAAFSAGVASITAKVTVKPQAAAAVDTVLVRPQPPALEAAPKPDESSRLYLPAGKFVDVPSGATVTVTVNAIVNMSEGVCALGSTTETLHLP